MDFGMNGLFGRNLKEKLNNGYSSRGGIQWEALVVYASLFSPSMASVSLLPFLHDCEANLQNWTREATKKNLSAYCVIEFIRKRIRILIDEGISNEEKKGIF